MAGHFNEPLFVISVAARLVQMHPQTLRKYEREGLIAPSRTQGNLRLYSDRDIERLRQVKYLVEDLGLNLAGVQIVLDITRRLRELRTFANEQATRIEEGQATKSFNAFRAELDSVLATLGFIDEEQVAEIRRRESRPAERAGSA
ncbi:MAG: MerR family transcriptional regulator [Chloroflexota bacterium]|jgi:MerR family transcriptional regulator/heat shock protein HspR|nr:MerR family transcriptional regulator [Chloroflexota bacterium]